jgi:ABC-type Mn2+/Zn2+ transport system permease subunit
MERLLLVTSLMLGMNSPITMLAFDDVGLHVFTVAWVTLSLLIFGLLASAAQALARVVGRADDIVYESMLGLDHASAQQFYRLYRSRHPKNVAFAWLCSVVAGPIGAFGYLRKWRLFAAAVVSLNGLGAWWIESWFSVPQIVLMENRDIAKWAIDRLADTPAGDRA